MKRLAGCLVVAACGGVSAPEIDARPAVDSSAADAPIDAPNCFSDSFDGTVLGAQWSVLAGATPTTYDVSASRLFIADAPFATTPSAPGTSWIYDLDLDKGNQIAWAHAIGGEDFTLTADIGWSSTGTDLTLGGIGVSDAQGVLAAMVGAHDGSSGLSGHPSARLHVVTGADMNVTGPVEEPGNLAAKIERRNGMARLLVDDVELVAGPMPALVSNIVIYFVRHNNGPTNYDFGSFEVREIRLCRP